MSTPKHLLADAALGGGSAPVKPTPARPGEPVGLMPMGLLLSIPLFAALGPEHGQQLASAGLKHRLARGQYLLRQGQPSRSLFVLLAGRAHVLRTGLQGREVILHLMRPGEHVGEMGLIDSQPTSASVRCEQPCDVLELDGAVLARGLSAQPALAHALMRSLVQRLRLAHRQIGSLGLHDVPGRLLRKLQDLALQGPDGVWRVPERLSRSELARMVGASREMVSRVMQDLEQQGHLRFRLDGSIELNLPPGTDLPT